MQTLEDLIFALREEDEGVREFLDEFFGDELGRGAHTATSRIGTELLGGGYTRGIGFSPLVSAHTMDLLGMLREGMSGAKSVLGGGQFFDLEGWDPGDIVANRVGQDQALANLRASARPPQINPYNVRFGGPATDSRSLLGILLESIYRSPNGVR
jgi:hypothetical protein